MSIINCIFGGHRLSLFSSILSLGFSLYMILQLHSVTTQDLAGGKLAERQLLSMLEDTFVSDQYRRRTALDDASSAQDDAMPADSKADAGKTGPTVQQTEAPANEILKPGAVTATRKQNKENKSFTINRRENTVSARKFLKATSTAETKEKEGKNSSTSGGNDVKVPVKAVLKPRDSAATKEQVIPTKPREDSTITVGNLSNSTAAATKEQDDDKDSATKSRRDKVIPFDNISKPAIAAETKEEDNYQNVPPKPRRENTVPNSKIAKPTPASKIAKPTVIATEINQDDSENTSKTTQKDIILEQSTNSLTREPTAGEPNSSLNKTESDVGNNGMESTSNQTSSDASSMKPANETNPASSDVNSSLNETESEVGNNGVESTSNQTPSNSSSMKPAIQANQRKQKPATMAVTMTNLVTNTTKTKTETGSKSKSTKSKAKSVSVEVQRKLESSASRSNDASPFAYSFVIGGCNPEQPRYRGFLYNILVSARLLRQFGSRADVVAFFQISSKTNATTLPDKDVRPLTALGVKIEYVPKTESESFYETVLAKFRILTLTQYQRVLLMDGDVMPLGNLDYFFELSVGKNPMLRENFLVNGPREPANAGFFMLAPGPGRYDEIIDIIQRREESSKNLTGHKFDPVKGWGHVIEPPDEWVARQARGNNWTFHFAFSDQGLLYYYAKYYRKSVSIAMGRKLVHNFYANNKDGVVRDQEQLYMPFANYSRPIFHVNSACNKFLCDFIHFSGKEKPWMSQPPADYRANTTEGKAAKHMWWHTLWQIDQDLSMGLNFTHWPTGKEQYPPLGLYAKYKDMDHRVESVK